MNGGRFCTTRIWRPPSLTVSWNEARFIRLDGPSGRTRHLKLEEKLEEPLPGATERFRISGKNGSEFPEPTGFSNSVQHQCNDRSITFVGDDLVDLLPDTQSFLGEQQNSFRVFLRLYTVYRGIRLKFDNFFINLSARMLSFLLQTVQKITLRSDPEISGKLSSIRVKFLGVCEVV